MMKTVSVLSRFICDRRHAVAIPWTLIIDAVIQLVTMCLERDSEAEVLRRLKNPTWRERWAFRRALLEHTELRGYRLRDAVREGIEMLRTDPSLAEEIVGAAKYGNEILYPAEQPVQSA
jgi:hypothetical protein